MREVDLVAIAARKFGEQPFLVSPDGVLSFADLERRVADSLPEGVHVGERVALASPGSEEEVVRLFALVRAGAVVLLVGRREPEAAIRKLKNLWRVGQQAGPGPRFVVLTSGSSGSPKAVVHTWDSLAASARGACSHLSFGPGKTWPLSLPTNHVGGLSILIRALVSGGAVWLPGLAWDLADLAARATHLSLVPTQLGRLLEASPLGPPERLERVLVGGASLSEVLGGRAVSEGWPIVRSYGLSEMGSLVTATEPGERSSSGRVLAGRRLRISETGQIQVSGEALFEGYLDGPIAGEWHDTGDLGELREDGRLYVTGRIDNMFVSGGENVQPERIEAALLSLEGVQQAMVVPVPDAEFGARPFAFVRTHQPPEVLERALRGELPGFMVPVAFHDFPGSLQPTGIKALRTDLAAAAARLHASGFKES